MKKADKILILVIIILSVSLALIMRLTDLKNEENNIVIKVSNKVIDIIPLNDFAESKIYEFNYEQIVGFIETKNGKARMLEMDKKICPQAICSETGWIDKSYQSIICLPNKIIVTIEGNSEESIDFIVK